MDGVNEYLATGICAVAASVLCAKGASRAQLDLAGDILKAADKQPKEAGPRESETIFEAFNRQMDAAIDAADLSRPLDTRAARRSALAGAIDRAGLCIIDKAVLAELLAPRIRALADPEGKWTVMPSDVDGHDLGEELLEQEERDHNGGYTLAEEAAAELDEAMLHGDYSRPEAND